jgi:parvulin-like peptidyl-prolyl isomerase
MALVRTLLGMVLLTAGCAELTKPSDLERTTLRPRAPAPPKVEPVIAPEPEAKPPPAEKISVSHILVSYKGALNAGPKVARSKADAKTLATRVLNRAKFEPFADLARTYSEDVTTKATGGDLGLLSEEELADLGPAAFKLKPGGLEVVETDFGFHIIRRAL